VTYCLTKDWQPCVQPAFGHLFPIFRKNFPGENLNSPLQSYWKDPRNLKNFPKFVQFRRPFRISEENVAITPKIRKFLILWNPFLLFSPIIPPLSCVPGLPLQFHQLTYHFPSPLLVCSYPSPPSVFSYPSPPTSSILLLQSSSPHTSRNSNNSPSLFSKAEGSGLPRDTFKRPSSHKEREDWERAGT
jgi:hypothetical protein